MTTLKSRLRISDFFTLSLILVLILLNSACGGRRLPSSTLTSRNSTQNGSDITEADIFAGGLVDDLSGSLDSSTSAQQLDQYGDGSQDGLLDLGQSAESFGSMNYCYNGVTQQAQSNLSGGWNVGDLFKEAGLALVTCYNQVLSDLSQQYSQAGLTYQQSMYQKLVNENNKLIGLIYSSSSSSTSGNTGSKPPAIKVTPPKTSKK